jgi:sugar/nucleoside kinase (ribokinase family)
LRRKTTDVHDTQGYFAVNLMHAQLNLLQASGGEDRIPAPGLSGILAFASEAATACCEKNGAMEAIPLLDEVIARFQAP